MCFASTEQNFRLRSCRHLVVHCSHVEKVYKLNVTSVIRMISDVWSTRLLVMILPQHCLMLIRQEG